MQQIKKIIHTADWHLKAKNGHKVFKKYLLDLFIPSVEHELKASSVKNDEAIVVIAGDLFHHKYLTWESMLVMHEVLTQVMTRWKTVIIIGNHDFNHRNPNEVDCITPIIDMIKMNPSIKPFVYSKSTESFTVGNNIKFYHFCDFDNSNLQVDEDTNVVKVGLNHSPMVGAKYSNGTSHQSKGSSVGLFEGCDMVLLGDIHLKQEIKPNILYCGSLFQQNYGEKIDGHGYYIWDIDTISFKFVEIKNINPYYNIKVNKTFDNYNIFNK